MGIPSYGTLYAQPGVYKKWYCWEHKATLAMPGGYGRDAPIVRPPTAVIHQAPGETVYMPSLMWHAVYTSGPAILMGASGPETTNLGALMRTFRPIRNYYMVTQESLEELCDRHGVQPTARHAHKSTYYTHRCSGRRRSSSEQSPPMEAQKRPWKPSSVHMCVSTNRNGTTHARRANAGGGVKRCTQPRNTHVATAYPPHN